MNTTIHKHRHDRFTQLPRVVTNGDTGLSLKATGLLAHVMGKPDNWRTYVAEVAKHFPDGECAIRSALRELWEHGYATLEVLRDKGRIVGHVWHVSDEPEFLKANAGRKNPKASRIQDNNGAASPDCGFLNLENLNLEKPDVEKPDVENRALQSAEGKQSSDWTGKKRAKKATTTTEATGSGGGGASPSARQGTSSHKH